MFYRFFKDVDAIDAEYLKGCCYMVVIGETFSPTADLTVYSPIGQHRGATSSYIAECVEITKEEYIKETEGFYTPSEYLK